MKRLATSNCMLSHNAATQATLSAQMVEDAKTAVDGNKALHGITVTVTLSDGSAGLITDMNGTGTGFISPTTSKAMGGQVPFNLEGDEAEILLNGTAGGNPITDTITVTISDAGQNKVLAE